MKGWKQKFNNADFGAAKDIKEKQAKQLESEKTN